MIPNGMIRNPSLSWKAKGILCFLLGNADNEWYSYKKTITGFGKAGELAIGSGIFELEKQGYLLRLRYRDIVKKTIRGSIWICTGFPNTLNWKMVKHRLKKHNLEPVNMENPQLENLSMGNPQPIKPTLKETPNEGNQSLTIPIFNKTNLKDSLSEEKSSDGVYMKRTKHSSNNGKVSIQERNKEFLPIAQKLSQIVSQVKNMKFTPNQIKAWTNDIRKLIEGNGITPKRVNTALNWYEKNIGGTYIPVIESGSSLRNKFLNLENAMNKKPGENGGNNSNFRSKGGAAPIPGKYDDTETTYMNMKTGESYISTIAKERRKKEWEDAHADM